MNRKIYRYPLEKGTTTIWIPRDFNILKAALKKDVVNVWIELEDSEDPCREPVIFQTFETGEIIPNNVEYLDTLISDTGYVYHIFVKLG